MKPGPPSSSALSHTRPGESLWSRSLRPLSALLGGAGASLLFWILSASSPEPTHRPLRTVSIAVSLPMALPEGKNIRDAIQLALSETRPPPGAPEVQAMFFDVSEGNFFGAGSSIREARIAREAAATESVVAYLGPISTELARVSLPILNEAGIAQISQSATWPGLTKIGFTAGEPSAHYPNQRRHFFRVVATDDRQGAAGAAWMKEMGLRTAFILGDDSSYGRGLGGIFELKARDLGIQVLGRETLRTPTSPERIAEVKERIAEQHFDLLYVGTVPSPTSFRVIRLLRGENPDLRIMLPDAFVSETFLSVQSPGVIEGIYGTSPMAFGNQETLPPDAALFVRLFEARYERSPTPIAMTTYEAFRVLLHAIHATPDPDRSSVLAALHDLEDYAGLHGSWSFDENGDISLSRIGCLRIHRGRWDFVRSFSD